MESSMDDLALKRKTLIKSHARSWTNLDVPAIEITILITQMTLLNALIRFPLARRGWRVSLGHTWIWTGLLLKRTADTGQIASSRAGVLTRPLLERIADTSQITSSRA